MAEDWVKEEDTPMLSERRVIAGSSGEGPSPREKATLLSKLLTVIETKFSSDVELKSQFLEIILYVYE
jgi:hypothetical protein